MKLQETHIEIFAAIPMPSNELFRDDGRDRVALYEMIDDLCALSGNLVVNLFEFGSIGLEIELLKAGRRRLKMVREHFDEGIRRKCEILRFSGVVPISDRYFDYQGLDPSGVNRSLARTSFLKRVSDVLVMSNISSIGSIELLHSILIQDGRLSEHTHLPAMNAWVLQRAVVLAESINWPRLRKIDFDKVWTWVNKNRGFIDGFDNSPTGRAISAFSRLFQQTEDDEAMQLLWALIGIEALYVKGKASIMEQVREKIQVLLGKQETHKRKIAEMYEFRSRFMHGDLDFPGLCLIHDASPEFERYTKNQMETVDIAIAILVATLQEIIIRNWNGLEFSYTASNVSNKGA